MVAELEVVVSAVTGALAGGGVRPLLAPTEALSEVWKEAIKSRITRTAQRASAKRQDSKWQVTERTAIRALTEAALTDSPVIQEYLAGVIAGATDTNDQSHMLALIGRLTPLQLRLHYQLYSGVTIFTRDEPDDGANWHSMMTRGSEAMNRRFATSLPALKFDNDDDILLRFWNAMEHLQREDLISDYEDYSDPVEDTETSLFFFRITGFGVELFATALGLEDALLSDICLLAPSSLELDPSLTPARVGDASEEAYRRLQLLSDQAGAEADLTDADPPF